MTLRHLVPGLALVAACDISQSGGNERLDFTPTECGYKLIGCNFADSIATTALWQVRQCGTEADARAAFATALALITELASRAPLAKVRPHLERVPWSGGTGWIAIKGTCCLLYKSRARVGPEAHRRGVTVDFEIDPEDEFHVGKIAEA